MVIQRAAQNPSAASLSALQTWLLGGNSHIHNAEVREPSPGHRGLFATADLPAGSPFLRVPPSHLISSQSARRAPHVATVLRAAEADTLQQQLPDVLGDSAALLLFVMAEQAKGADSTWHVWFRSLPSRFRTPIVMDMPDVEDLLSGTTLLPLVETLRGELREMYDAWFVPYAVRRNPEVYPVERCSFEAFLYAHAVIESRAFKIDDVTMLVPFADMANHQPNASPLRTAKARGWAIVDSPDAAATAPRDLGLELFVGEEPVRRGQELCISYGALPNWQLLLHYGFAMPSNPEEAVVISLQVPEDDPQPLYMMKMLFLNMELMADLEIDHSLRVRDPLPVSLLASTRLLLLNETESASININNANFRKPVSERNEKAVVPQLQTLVEAMLSGFDVFEGAEASSDSDNSFASFCGMYVNGQREILTRAMQSLDTLSSTIPTPT